MPVLFRPGPEYPGPAAITSFRRLILQALSILDN